MIRLINGLLALWLLFSSVTFGYLHTPFALGEIVCALALLVRPYKWLSALIGLYLQAAPLLFAAPESVIYLNETLIGVLIIAFSALLSEEKETLSIPPEGFSYNPSSYVQRVPILLLTFLCWMIARYLAAFQLGYISSVWDPFFGDGSESVLTSAVSKSLPISDAGLGALAYSIEFLLLCKGGPMRFKTMPWLVLSFGFLVIPVGLVSIFLIILQPLLVHAWCSWCLLTALLMLLMIVFSVDEVVATLRFLRISKKPLWILFWKGEALADAPAYTLEPAYSAETMLRGTRFRLQLIASALVGMLLFFFPLYPWDYIIAAIIVTLSILAIADLLYPLRRANLLLGLILFLGGLVAPSFSHIALGLLLMFLGYWKWR